MTDMFCLQFVFIPRINKLLKSFHEAWNSHGLSAECNWFPAQLFTAFSQCNSLIEEDIDPDVYGIGSGSDEDSTDEEVEIVIIPRIPPPVCEHDVQALQIYINHLQESNSYGTDLYVQTIYYVNDVSQISEDKQ